jgi:ribosomal protein S14
MSEIKFKWREPKKRKLYKEKELERKILKSIIQNLSLKKKFREKAQDKLGKMSKNSSITRINNRCIITSRGRGNIRKFNISRIIFREWASSGKLAGIKKEGNG